MAVIISSASLRASAQPPIPAFTGVWELDMQASKVEAKHPPISSTATVQFDGEVWHFTRTHRYANKKTDTWSNTLVVGSGKDRVHRDPPLTIRARMTRAGETLILHEDYTADTGEKATNTVRYSLRDGGNTLVEGASNLNPRYRLPIGP